MQQDIFKLIELQDEFVDHGGEFPFADDMPGKPILFSLRSKKVLKYQPILIIDHHTQYDPVLPLIPGSDLSSQVVLQNCVICTGTYQPDGQWVCTTKKLLPGITNYQLVFVERGQNIVIEIGTYDAVLVKQNRFNLLHLRKQTVFPRCIGKHTEWPSFLKKQIEIGYNAFHFAPIQQPGSSKSYYSINNQLELSNEVFQGSGSQKYEQLEAIIKPLQKSGIVFFVDIVLNHTSYDSQWIKQDTKSVYTIENTPCLKSSYELDTALRKWGDEIKSNFADSQLKMDEEQFEELKQSLTNLVRKLNLHEYFQIKKSIKQEFLKAVETRPVSENIFAKDPSQIVQQFIEQSAANVGCQRYGIQINNLESKWKKLNPTYEQDDLTIGIEKYNEKWKNRLENQWIPQIIRNILDEIKYNYLDNQYRSYDDPYPFIKPYFSIVHSKDGQKVPALNNGWVMNADTSENMVTTRNFYYLRRKVNVWGDLIRIRYGDRPQDSPSWVHMQNYVRKMAEMFDGFRLDNLHGTPLHVAEYMIQQARKCKPELIIFAELFTSSDKQTAMFTRKAGINSILSQLKHHLSGPGFLYLFHKTMGHYGKYTGSLSPFFKKGQNTLKYLTRDKPIDLIYDQTHDNSTYQDSGVAVVKTPICLLLELAGAFIGSTKGFDQFYSHKIQVTETSHLYLQDERVQVKFEQLKTLKKTIVYTDCQNQRVQILGSWNFWKQGSLLQEYGKGRKGLQLDLPPGHYQYKFKVNGQWQLDPKKPHNENGNHYFILQKKQPIKIYTDLEELRKTASKFRTKYQNYREYYAYNDGDLIFLLRQSKDHEHAIFVIVNFSTKTQTHHGNIVLPGEIVLSDIWQQSEFSLYEGLNTAVQIKKNNNLFEYFDYYTDEHLGKDILMGTQLPPGYACFIQCKKSNAVNETIKSIKQLKNQPIHLPPLGTLDYNTIMFGIDQQQIVHSSSSNYVIPKQNRKLIFGGFAGIFRDIKLAKKVNNLSMPLFDNLRQGNWLLDYYIGRLKRHKNLNQVTDIIQRYFECLKRIPAYLKPKYFTTFIYNFCVQIERQITPSGSQLRQKLGIATHQFLCSFDHPNPLFKVTMAAGLPHFSTGWSRSWGRDTFISNQLLLLHPSIHKQIILQFASTLRHGMIPNLLDFGNNPRYNCRDACWWFIRSIHEYARKTKDYQILKSKVSMIFLSNDQFEHKRKKKQGEKKIMLLQDIVQQIFQCHAHGITFRQWNAGFEIDQNMNSQGFTIKLHVDEITGFVLGGNSFNCLTWMDKMGSSAKAGNKGFPATPRAGAPVELTALLYYCLTAFSKLHQEGHYSYSTVAFYGHQIKYSIWAERIRNHFDKAYFISQDTDKAKYIGIYRDVVSPPNLLFYQSLRLRPNALIALAVVPELFKKQHALSYLRVVESQLLFNSSIGISTLGQAHDTLYCPYYDNSDDSVQLKQAHGFSYHNGPEWVWLYGFYVIAKGIFEPELNRQQLFALLQPHSKYIDNDQWQSLPQITDRNGIYNKFSCPSQAWSISSILMAYNYIDESRPYKKSESQRSI